MTMVFAQIGFITDFYFYLKVFVADIRYQLIEDEFSTELEMKRKLIDIVRLHCSIMR